MQCETRKFGSVLSRFISRHPTTCLLLTKNYENSHFNLANYTGKVCLGLMIYVGNGRIHIHVLKNSGSERVVGLTPPLGCYLLYNIQSLICAMQVCNLFESNIISSIWRSMIKYRIKLCIVGIDTVTDVIMAIVTQYLAN